MKQWLIKKIEALKARLERKIVELENKAKERK
jgi:hypothetical protein